MKNKDILKSLFLHSFKNKRNIFIVVISIISSLISLITLTVYVTINSYIENNYTKNIGFKTLNVYYNENSDYKDVIDEEKLKKINHVVEVYNSKYSSFTTYSDLNDNEFDGIITFSSITNNIPINVVNGTTIFEIYKDSISAICPVNFYPDSSAFDVDINIKEKFVIDGYTLLGKTFNIEYYNYNDSEDTLRPEKKDTYTNTIQIVGLYHTNDSMTTANTCYISLEDQKKIIDTIDKNDLQLTSTFVFVDELENINEVISKINDLGYSVEVVSSFDANLVNKITDVCFIISFISITLTSILLILYIKKKLICDSSYIGVKRTVGYSIKDIEKCFFAETFLTLFITYVLSLLVFIIIYFIAKKFIFDFIRLYNITIVINRTVFMYSVIGIIIVPLLISSIDIIKTSKTKIIDLIKVGE